MNRHATTRYFSCSLNRLHFRCPTKIIWIAHFLLFRFPLLRFQTQKLSLNCSIPFSLRSPLHVSYFLLVNCHGHTVFFAFGRSEVEPHPLRKSISLVGANLQKGPEMCELPTTNLPSRNKPFGANERATHIYMRLITLLSGATATVFADDAT